MEKKDYIEKTEKEIDVSLNEAWTLIRTDLKQAFSIIKKAEKLAIKINYDKGIAFCMILLARYNAIKSSNYDEALQLASEGNELAISIGSDEVQIKASYVLGYLYTDLGNLELGLRNYFRGLELMKEKNEEIDPFFLNNIGVVYYDSGQFDEALEFLQEALKTLRKIEKVEYIFESLVLANIAEIYLIKKNTETALKFINESFIVLKENGAESHCFAQNYNVLGLIYKEIGDFQKALENLQLSLSLYKENNQKYMEANGFKEIGKLYLSRNRKEEAIINLKNGLKIAERINAFGMLKDIYMVLAEIAEKDNDYKNAFNYLKSYNELNEKIKTKELDDKLVQHMTEFKVEKAQKDAEIQRLKNEELRRKSEETALKARALAESYEDIKIIGEIGQKITATLDIKKVLNMVYKNINKLMDADIFGICLYNAEQGLITFRIMIEQGKRLPLIKTTIDNEKSFAAKCIREKQAVCLNNIIADSNQQLRYGHGVTKMLSKSIIYYPLIVEDKVVGAMTVQSYRENAYSERSMGMIKALASYIAIALNNSQKSEELKAKSNELEILSKTDVLTGVFNRRYLMDRIEEEALNYKKTQQEFSVVILDIDYFKKVNDIYGHDCGDYILVKLTKLLKTSMRRQDILARWGGEEFLMLLPNTKGDAATSLCEGIRKKIEGTNFVYRKNKIKLTVTFGVEEYNESLGVDSTINNADKNLYKGKNQGRNCVVSH
ncbi:diguanylate cyclase (GGDEF)-like protein [Clostridium punense]|uniref:Diguanylate cyclase (GGDEF)-like protein n=1 Tax=Clostridium punense TaxID=1054297 RepID=A0ABS4K685_9CLOT|nr:diguanylate cyclase (GGDEF)-like protein [Clostridium punense]